MLIAEMYPLDIKIEHGLFSFLKIIIVFFGGKWRCFPWSYNEFKKTKQKSKL